MGINSLQYTKIHFKDSLVTWYLMTFFIEIPTLAVPMHTFLYTVFSSEVAGCSGSSHGISCMKDTCNYTA
jgi:hypothetical protein